MHVAVPVKVSTNSVRGGEDTNGPWPASIDHLLYRSDRASVFQKYKLSFRVTNVEYNQVFDLKQNMETLCFEF